MHSVVASCAQDLDGGPLAEERALKIVCHTCALPAGDSAAKLFMAKSAYVLAFASVLYRGVCPMYHVYGVCVV